jgi:molecular chaperone GrpE
MSDPTIEVKPEGGEPTAEPSEAKAEGAPAAKAEETAPPTPPTPEELLAQAKAEAAKTKEQLLRTAADFDNFRKRSRKEIEDARKAGKEDLLKEFLPVFDNLERGMQSAKNATDVSAVAEGLSMVLRQFVDTLGKQGITKVPTVGTPFDPSVHEAIQQVESDEPVGNVVAEVQSGYVQAGRLVRAAFVVVAKPRAS